MIISPALNASTFDDIVNSQTPNSFSDNIIALNATTPPPPTVIAGQSPPPNDVVFTEKGLFTAGLKGEIKYGINAIDPGLSFQWKASLGISGGIDLKTGKFGASISAQNGFSVELKATQAYAITSGSPVEKLRSLFDKLPVGVKIEIGVSNALSVGAGTTADGNIGTGSGNTTQTAIKIGATIGGRDYGVTFAVQGVIAPNGEIQDIGKLKALVDGTFGFLNNVFNSYGNAGLSNAEQASLFNQSFTELATTSKITKATRFYFDADVTDIAETFASYAVGIIARKKVAVKVPFGGKVKLEAGFRWPTGQSSTNTSVDGNQTSEIYLETGVNEKGEKLYLIENFARRFRPELFSPKDLFEAGVSPHEIVQSMLPDFSLKMNQRIASGLPSLTDGANYSYRNQELWDYLGVGELKSVKLGLAIALTLRSIAGSSYNIDYKNEFGKRPIFTLDSNFKPIILKTGAGSGNEAYLLVNRFLNIFERDAADTNLSQAQRSEAQQILKLIRENLVNNLGEDFGDGLRKIDGSGWSGSIPEQNLKLYGKSEDRDEGTISDYNGRFYIQGLDATKDPVTSKELRSRFNGTNRDIFIKGDIFDRNKGVLVASVGEMTGRFQGLFKNAGVAEKILTDAETTPSTIRYEMRNGALVAIVGGTTGIIVPQPKTALDNTPAGAFRDVFAEGIRQGLDDATAGKAAYDAFNIALQPSLSKAYLQGYMGTLERGRSSPFTAAETSTFLTTFARERASGKSEADAAALAAQSMAGAATPNPDTSFETALLAIGVDRAVIRSIDTQPVSNAQTLISDASTALEIANESKNTLGAALLNVVIAISNVAIESNVGDTRIARETSGIAAAARALGVTYAEVMQLVGRGDLAAFGAVIGDLGQLYKDAKLSNDGLIVGSSFKTFGDTLFATGRVRGDQSLMLSGLVLSGAGDMFRSLNDGKAGTAQAVGIQFAGKLASYLGTQSNSSILKTLGNAMSSSVTIAGLFNNQRVVNGNVVGIGDGQAALAEAASLALGTLLGGNGGEALSKVGSLVATGIRIASNTVPGGAGSLYVTAARQVLDLIGVKLDGPTNMALGLLSTVLASNPVGWVAFSVGVLLNLFSMGSFSKTSLLQNNIDADGDQKFDDSASLQRDFYRGFFGGVRQTGNSILYDVNGIDMRLLQSARVTLTPEILQVPFEFAGRPLGNELRPIFGRVTVDGKLLTGRVAFTSANSGTFYYMDSGVRKTLEIFADPTDPQRWTMSKITGNSIYKIEATYGAINPSTSPLVASKTSLLSAAEAAAHIAELGGSDVTLIAKDSRLKEGSLLSGMLDQVHAQYQGTKNDPNFYIYMDMNADGLTDLVRIGLQLDSLRVKGDGKVSVTLLDSNKQAISSPITGNTFKEVEDMATLAPNLYAWGLSNPALWAKALADQAIKNSSTGKLSWPDVATLAEAARTTGALSLMREAQNLSNALLADIMGGKEVQFDGVLGRLGVIDQALNVKFNAQQYMEANPDVANWAGGNGIKAAEHYAQYGNIEGRAINSNGTVLQKWNLLTPLSAVNSNDIVQPPFQEYDYIASYPQLISAFATQSDEDLKQSGKLHYAQFGKSANWSIRFSAENYLNAHPDVKLWAAGDLSKAALHYIRWGYREGRALAAA